MIFKGSNQRRVPMTASLLNNEMNELIRDCSKSKPSTFCEISFPISLEIQNKIRAKNMNLRQRYLKRLQEKQKYYKREGEQVIKREVDNFDKSPSDYLQLYRTHPEEKNNSQYQPNLVSLENRDQKQTRSIYLLLKKRKPIFKVEQTFRRLRKEVTRKSTNYKQCNCCGLVGKHECSHLLCKQECTAFKRQSLKNQYFPKKQNQQLIAQAQGLIKQNLNQEGVKTIKITVKNEDNIFYENEDTPNQDIKEQLIENVKYYEQSPERMQNLQQDENKQLENIKVIIDTVKEKSMKIEEVKEGEQQKNQELKHNDQLKIDQEEEKQEEEQLEKKEKNKSDPGLQFEDLSKDFFTF